MRLLILVMEGLFHDPLWRASQVKSLQRWRAAMGFFVSIPSESKLFSGCQ